MLTKLQELLSHCTSEKLNDIKKGERKTGKILYWTEERQMVAIQCLLQIHALAV